MALPHDLCYSITDIRLLHEYHDSYSSVLWYFSVVMSIVTCLVGLVGNAIVICFIGFVMKKHKSKYWFLNLAIADLFCLLSLPLHTVASLKGTWTFGPHICKLFLFCLCVNMYSSIYILISLNIARVLSVAQPMFHLKFISRRVSFCICFLIWCITALFSLPVFFYSGEVKIGEVIQCSSLCSQSFSSAVVNNGYNVSTENATSDIFVSDIYTNLKPYIEQCSSDRCCGGEESLNFWNHLLFTSKLLLIPFLIIGYFIPLGVVIICNIIIAVQVRKSKTVNPHRLYRIVLMIIMVYFITWTPAVISIIVFLIAVHNMNLIAMIKVHTFMPLMMSIAYANSCLNPIVYVLTGGQMRTTLSEFISNFRNNNK